MMIRIAKLCTLVFRFCTVFLSIYYVDGQNTKIAFHAPTALGCSGDHGVRHPRSHHSRGSSNSTQRLRQVDDGRRYGQAFVLQTLAVGCYGTAVRVYAVDAADDAFIADTHRQVYDGRRHGQAFVLQTLAVGCHGTAVRVHAVDAANHAFIAETQVMLNFLFV